MRFEIGGNTAQAIRNWIAQADRDEGRRADGLTTAEHEELNRLRLFDPWQMQAIAQRLRRVGIKVEEFPQSPSNLTTASQNLFELIQGQGLVV